MNNNDYLDNLNTERVETTKMRVVHAIKLLQNPLGCLEENKLFDNTLIDIAHAVNLLEAAHQDMKFACDHFKWDSSICDSIMKACRYLGECMAIILDEKDNECDFQCAGYSCQDALSILGVALASLVRWFDDTQDVSEI